jgi:hypothetical protein
MKTGYCLRIRAAGDPPILMPLGRRLEASWSLAISKP